MQICKKGAEALAEKHGTVYKVGNIAEIICKSIFFLIRHFITR